MESFLRLAARNVNLSLVPALPRVSGCWNRRVAKRAARDTAQSASLIANMTWRIEDLFFSNDSRGPATCRGR